MPADQDVAKRVFYLSEGKIRVDYHYGEGRITRSGRVFHKDGQSQIVQVRWHSWGRRVGGMLSAAAAVLGAEVARGVWRGRVRVACGRAVASRAGAECGAARWFVTYVALRPQLLPM